MKFLLIGNGFIAPIHKEAIKNIQGEIVGIVDESQGEEKWREEVAKTNADCVVVLTPNDLHFEMAKTASECGKTVLCEKPLALSSGHVKILAEKPNIFTVFQLRHHPLAKELKAEINNEKKYNVEIDVSVYRDEHYYKCWKGQKERSGGVLFNLGVHFFDLLLYLFGPAEKIKTTFLNPKTGKGTIGGKNYACNWRISTDETKENQRRVFKIDGKDYNFSSKDNLAYENLHRFVYQDLMEGRGVTPKEALKVIELIENLYESYEKKN